MANIPLMVRCIRSSGCCSTSKYRNEIYKYSMLILTFFCYMSYHISRKPLSIVKGALHQNCSLVNPNNYNHWFGSIPNSKNLEFAPITQDFSISNHSKNGTWCDFAPFDKSNYKSLYGDLDYAFLITYAFGMFFSGIIAERVSIRYFLSCGMVLSGIFTSMFGLGYFFSIHSFTFYVFAQVLNGLMQTTGWPGVVTCVGNWFGKNKRGLIMGIWNSHTSFGNILGSVIGSVFVGWAWGYSFIVPGIIIAFLGIVTFFTLIDHPNDVGIYVVQQSCDPSYQPLPSDEDSIEPSEALSCSSKYSSISADKENLNVSVKNNPRNDTKQEAIGFLGALKIPGVIEFSLCLLFAKLVSYTFLFWLPFYILKTSQSKNVADSGLMSTLFDVGGIFGGISAGLISDRIKGRALTCGFMLIIGAVMMFLFNVYGSVSSAANVSLLLVTGAFVNGPYALITTAVSADLGTHQVLMGNARALSTVTAIIDGTGSIGAAIGPFLTGLIVPSGWQNVFYMLICSNLFALVFLGRLMFKEIKALWYPDGIRSHHSSPRLLPSPSKGIYEDKKGMQVNNTEVHSQT